MQINDAEDSLANIPLGNLRPGELAIAFSVRARVEARKHEDETTQELHTMQVASHERDHEEEDSREEMIRREEMLLIRLNEQERLIAADAEALDRRAIKLADGKRAYVDGDGYRDAEGRELTGADRAEAEVLHVDQPQAATWHEEQEIQKRWSAAESARHDIEVAQAGGGTNESKLLDSADNKLRDLTNDSQAKSHALPDYGSGDYMRELAGITVSKSTRPGL